MTDSTGPGLSRTETNLLSAWERAGRTHVTIHDFEQQAPDHDPYVLASRLLNKGLLHRVARGVFLVRALRTVGRPWSPTAMAATAALLANETYYVGGWWVLSFHRLTEQVYGSILDAFVTRRRRQREVASARIRFHVLKPTAFTWGIVATEIETQRINISDPERTVLDGLETPATFTSVRAGCAILEDVLRTSELDRERLVDYAIRNARPSTRARLGVLLEDTSTPERLLRRLERSRNLGRRTVVSLIPDAPRTGHLRGRWSVIDNRDIAE